MLCLANDFDNCKHDAKLKQVFVLFLLVRQKISASFSFLLQAKVNNSGQVGLGYTQQIRDGKYRYGIKQNVLRA